MKTNKAPKKSSPKRFQHPIVRLRRKRKIATTNAALEQGLTSKQVAERVAGGQINRSKKSIEKSYFRIIMENTFTFFNCVLYAIALVFLGLIIFLGRNEPETLIKLNLGATKFIFLIAVLMNAVIGSVQGIRSKITLKKLRIVTESKATVVRDGEKKLIPANDIVRDDILFLETGEQVSVDLEVVTGMVRVDESLLTGEADLVEKNPGDKLYSGSVVFVGSCYARTEKVGDETYASTLSNKVRSIHGHKSELMVNIYRIINFLAIFLLIMAAVIVGTLIYKVNKWGGSGVLGPGVDSLDDALTWGRIIVTTASFCIGVIPTGLVLLTSITLAVSIMNLSKKQTLIQELYSLENLSRVDVICLDKTGTLTDGTMSVCGTNMFIPQEQFERVLRRILGCFETGNLTSKALLEHFGKEEPKDLVEAIPFSSETKCSGYKSSNGHTFLLGAPEYIAKGHAKVEAYAKAEAEKGHRVLALTMDDEPLGLVALEDGVRPSAKATLSYFYDNNVDVRIISGDNPLTVSRIASIAGVKNADKAISLEGMPVEKIIDIVDDYVVFARVSPEQKQALVEALQAHGHKVAMTGDGVNDILALRKANASITFVSATDAAKSCSDVVLLDNDFSHLQAVVGEGRRVVNNMERTSVFFLMKTIAIAGLAFGLIPFREAQLLYNLENVYLLETAIIGTGGFFMSLEPTKEPIRGKFMRNVLTKAIPSGILIWIGAMMPVVLYKTNVISADMMRSMISSMTMLGGLSVLVAMAIPFNKWRVLTVSLVIGNILLFALALPRVFIGALSLQFSPDTISIIFHEIFQPWNAPSITCLFVKPEGGANWWSIGPMVAFVAVMIPTYAILLRILDRKKNAKDARDTQEDKR